ncbi:hypothetical protein HJC23_010912 [Cyclotella cryptica]|uniref:Uncharacterized protein n=1 Tax=Cyclotella cryptica TaxID=29204 RepID=A0ABD3Q9C3_9STRA|eukprot:CCRYP_007547-RA/>CCRYP_007547-RA protein AED:0.44 eAED:0.44 QI:0/-1/0/1/-1/1/1/0/218
MSTSHQRGGLRRPLDSINANTITASFSKAAGSATVHQGALKPIKTEKKRGGLLSRGGLFSSILTTSKKRSEKETSGVDDSLTLESPTKKTRVGRVDTLPHSQTMPNVDEDDYSIGIFRRSTKSEVEGRDNFWSDDTEELLCLKLSRPIIESRDDETSPGHVERDLEERDGQEFYEKVRCSLAMELDVGGISSAEHILCLSHGHVKEHETDGLKLEFRE